MWIESPPMLILTEPQSEMAFRVSKTEEMAENPGNDAIGKAWTDGATGSATA